MARVQIVCVYSCLKYPSMGKMRATFVGLRIYFVWKEFGSHVVRQFEKNEIAVRWAHETLGQLAIEGNSQ